MILSKILYAEDDPDVQGITAMALEMVGGFKVKVCNNGQEALDQVKVFVPDLILLDVMMPVLDGPSTFERLKQDPEMAKIPVVFFTAKVLEEEVASYKAMGVLGVIAKPFDPWQLPDQLQTFWRRSQWV